MLTPLNLTRHPLKITIKGRHQVRALGREGSEEQFSSQKTYLRRQLSVCCVRAVADCLLTRLLQVGKAGPEAGAAARRSSIALGLEERGRKEGPLTGCSTPEDTGS